MEKFFVKYQRFLGTVFTLWLFLWLAGKFGLNFGVDLRILFRILFSMSLILAFRETKKRKVEIVLLIKSVVAQSEIPSALEQYPTTWSKAIHFPSLMFSFSWKLFRKYALSRAAILVFCALGIFVDIFVFNFTSDLVILVLVGLWIYLIRIYKFTNKVSFATGLILLAVCPLVLIMNRTGVAEKVAIWAYMFLAVGIVQVVIKYGQEIKNEQIKEV